MRMLTALIAALVLVSCSKTEVQDDPVTASSVKAANLQKAKKLLLSPNSDQILTEIAVINKATGKQTTAYVVSSGTTTSVVAPYPGWSISSGWILHNDGCFYHGTIYTGSDGQYIFVEDPNPYTDGYIGNEPRCGNGNIA